MWYSGRFLSSAHGALQYSIPNLTVQKCFQWTSKSSFAELAIILLSSGVFGQNISSSRVRIIYKEQLWMIWIMFVHRIGGETPASPWFFLVSRLRIDASRNTCKPRNSDGNPVRNWGGGSGHDEPHRSKRKCRQVSWKKWSQQRALKLSTLLIETLLKRQRLHPKLKRFNY